MEWRSNFYFALKVSVCVIIVGTGVRGAMSSTGLMLFAFQVLAAVGFTHAVELQHQAIHSLGFSNRATNYMVGVLLGIPMLVSFSGYQDAHLRHHQTVGTNEDKEFFEYGNKRRSDLYNFLLFLFIPKHYTKFLLLSAKAFVGWDVACRNVKASRRMRGEYLLFAIVIAALVAASIYYSSYALFTSWLIPLVLIAGPLHALIELPEHYGCNKRSRNYFENTRSITSGWFMTWFTNGNNFHVEHHLRPSVRMEELSMLHRAVKHEIRHLNKTYLEFYWDLIKQRFRRANQFDTTA